MSTRPRVSAPRSLADDLRARSDESLAALLGARPDLAQPAPSDTPSLAARASTRVSVQRALDRLDTATLGVVHALAALPGPVSRAELARACGGRVTEHVELLHERALVWGSSSALHLVRTVAEVIGRHPARLGPPLVELAAGLPPSRVAGWCADLGLPGSGDPVTDATAVAQALADPDRVSSLLAQAPDGAARLLAKLSVDGPVGEVADAGRTARAATASGPVEWLLAHALLVPVDDRHVVLPREAGFTLRGGRALVSWSAEPPALVTDDGLPAGRVTSAAAGAAAEAVRLVHELAELWSIEPATVLRGGGLGVRELRRVAAALDVDETTAARTVELAYAAGLVAQDGEVDPAWMPTPAYDVWLSCDAAEQWLALAQAWQHTSRVPSLVGTRDSRNSVRSALGDAVERPAVTVVRRQVLEVLGCVPPGAVVRRDSLAERLAWLHPRGPGQASPHLVDAVLDDAAWLGVTASGALSPPGRALLDPGADAAAVLMQLLPTPVQHVLLQADLTAVAPGRLTADVARELGLMADVDSRGGATVYRFDGGSIRRALDAGRTAADLLAFLTEHSTTPVPQPLAYLVGDVARRHGRIRVGGASAYLRSDDETVLGELLADRRVAMLRLRRLAPTVLAAQADPGTVLQTLRQLGLAPAVEAPDGTVVLRRPDARRTRPRERPRPVGHPPQLSHRLAEAVVAGIRRGDTSAAETARYAATQPDAPATPTMEPTVSLAALRRAAADRRKVWIGVSDAGGRVARRLVEPLGVAAGRITVFDHGVGDVRTVSIHRVTGVAGADDDAAGETGEDEAAEGSRR